MEARKREKQETEHARERKPRIWKRRARQANVDRASSNVEEKSEAEVTPGTQKKE